MPPSISSLTDRTPQMSGEELAASLVPPRQFEQVTLDNYRPDPDFPSQAEALEAARAFVAPRQSAGLFSRKKAPAAKPGLYLDGGFGVGKTHLLAALWKLAPGRKYFGTFIEYTALVGALGYQNVVKLFSGADLLCIDEFELDDPGDTMVMTRLLGELVATGTRLAATSNTPPNALGEGRFAAQDFLREIHAMAESFQTIRIDGTDYRQRALDGHAVSLADDEYPTAIADAAARGVVSDDAFDALIDHLARVHPSRYIRLLDGLDVIGLRDVHQLDDQSSALRLVAFIDRAYDAQIPIRASGRPLDEVFGDEMLAGGYRKKYLRAVSRLNALTHE